MNKKKYISLAKSSVDTQLRELKKIKTPISVLG